MKECVARPGYACHSSVNPRKQGWCVACGQRVEGRPAYDRNPVLERAYVNQIALGVGLDATSLNDYADHRALDGPVWLEDDAGKPRSFHRDAIEEIADLRNYTVWKLFAVLLPQADDPEVAEEIAVWGHRLAATIQLWHTYMPS